MIEALVTSAGLVLRDAELLWIRSDGPLNTVELIQGTSMAVQGDADRWLYFATSECLGWNEDQLGCVASRLHVGLTAGVPYDIVTWTEAANRREPERDMVPLTDDWPFDPADVNLDGMADCGDRAYFESAPYDWDLDGVVTAADLDRLESALAASRADIDGDGGVGPFDLLDLLDNWDCAAGPDAPCPGDLNCDGATGIEDVMLLLTQWGA